MFKNPNVETAVNELIKAVKSTKTYEVYNEKRQIAEKDDSLRAKIQRTRIIREQINNMSEYEKNNPMSEALMDEYDNLMDITAVHEFSLAELDFCNMYKDVMACVVNSFNLDIKGE